MGRAIDARLSADPDFELGFRADRAFDAGSSPAGVAQGADLSGLVHGQVVAIIDFSSPDGLQDAARAASRLCIPLVSGTTGMNDITREALLLTARTAPVCWAPNFSIGIPLLAGMVRDLARATPASWQAEIAETHHAAKRDAPSGTALRLAEAWKSVRGGRFVHGREGMTGPRKPEEIGIHAIRIGDVVGEHRVLIGGVGETLEIVHRMQDRTAFAAGCLEALRRLMRRGPGWYEWEDLLSSG
jgi:4-hydroxy-tetrahydrodipicolinate reductase